MQDSSPEMPVPRASMSLWHRGEAGCSAGASFWHPQPGAWLGKNSSKWISSTESTAHQVGLRTEQACSYAALCWLQHREQEWFQTLLLLLTFKRIL